MAAAILFALCLAITGISVTIDLNTVAHSASVDTLNGVAGLLLGLTAMAVLRRWSR